VCGREQQPAVASPATPDGSIFTSLQSIHGEADSDIADGSYKLTDHWKLAAGDAGTPYKSQGRVLWGIDARYRPPAAAPTWYESFRTGASTRGVNLSYEPKGT